MLVPLIFELLYGEKAATLTCIDASLAFENASLDPSRFPFHSISFSSKACHGKLPLGQPLFLDGRELEPVTMDDVDNSACLFSPVLFVLLQSCPDCTVSCEHDKLFLCMAYVL